jgi:hypothetical protein
MPNIEKRDYIQSTVVFILTALLTFWLDARMQSARETFSADINKGLDKVQRYHKTGERPTK